jgi:hypothetical protein
MKQEDVTKWERENMEKITGWVAEWDVIPDFKVITFSMSDKSKVRFEVDLRGDHPNFFY